MNQKDCSGKNIKNMPKGPSQQKPGTVVEDNRRITPFPIKMIQRASGLLLSPRSRVQSPRDRMASKEGLLVSVGPLSALPSAHCLVKLHMAASIPHILVLCSFATVEWQSSGVHCGVHWSGLQCSVGCAQQSHRAQSESRHGGRSFQSLGSPISALQSPVGKISLAGSVGAPGRTPPQWT